MLWSRLWQRYSQVCFVVLVLSFQLDVAVEEPELGGAEGVLHKERLVDFLSPVDQKVVRESVQFIRVFTGNHYYGNHD